ncbi:hypothetical protein ABID65_007561 [Bradyrhizobium sp. S3.9.2]|uniref:hypothetical protein n=1 Tax=Bradyrhizobium sp. S3.9.2 TaxID=3156432 RepID=UPI0033915DA9
MAKSLIRRFSESFSSPSDVVSFCRMVIRPILPVFVVLAANLAVLALIVAGSAYVWQNPDPALRVYAVAFFAGVVSCGLIYIVVSDLIERRAAAKRLARFVGGLSPAELRYLRWFVARRFASMDEFERDNAQELANNQLARMFSPSRDFPPRPKAEGRWFDLVWFLTLPFGHGKLAADALFQQSLIGRTRYLENVIMMSNAAAAAALREASRSTTRSVGP